ncbi:hypothetical protein TEA_022325 [Camellia sinensis var. sinensis]|uniref:Uncharacterized protein n=1 Tax=Camellia sinensis var. sinensis TaxID=542762 RepID=A0A4S4D3G3_CAMSN|nr:hypothetical protein TEA_022325 [Camellia sinensis var. sinensis]
MSGGEEAKDSIIKILSCFAGSTLTPLYCMDPIPPLLYRKKNTIDIVETDKSYIVSEVMMDAPAAEHDGKCKCDSNCACVNCTYLYRSKEKKQMVPQKQAEAAIDTEQDDDQREEERVDESLCSFKSLVWHGGSDPY